jgi:hypothetical protein
MERRRLELVKLEELPPVVDSNYPVFGIVSSMWLFTRLFNYVHALSLGVCM